MMTVNKVSKISGVSIRTLQYYDSIGLLKPVKHTESGYRLYDDTALERLQQIMLFKELEFSLKEIIQIIDAPDFDKEKALEQQIELLRMKKERLDKLIDYALKIKEEKGNTMNFDAFDKKKIDEYSKKAKEQWGDTKEYKEFETKSKGRTEEKEKSIADEFMQIFAGFGRMTALSTDCEEVKAQVKKLQDFITEHYYTCTDEILLSLGQMYSAGGEFAENIDKAGGNGTAEFVTKAIENFCR